MGHALAHILAGNTGVRLSLFDKDAAKVTRAALPLPEVVKGAEIVFMCVPSWAMREAIEELKPHLSSGVAVVSLAKGIEPERKQTMDALLAELLPTRIAALLGGPMLAAEFMQNMPGVGCVAAEDPHAGERLTTLFAGTLLSLEYIADVRGVALAGALKNIYALGLGIASGLSWGDNQKGALITRALAEMAGIAEVLGGKRETAYSLAGVGDLIATGFSAYSRNNQFGEEFVRTGVCNIQSEGCASLPLMAEILGEKRSAFPVFQTLLRVIIQGADAKKQFEKMLSRA